MTTTTHGLRTEDKASPSYEIGRVDDLAVLDWLKRGMDDFLSIPGLSLLYGVLFAAACGVAYLLSTSTPWYTVAFLTGLVVVGPFLASGLYAASRDRERGVTPSIGGSLRLLNRRKTYLALFSMMLALVMAAWVRFTALVFAIKFNSLSPSIEAYSNMFSSADGWITLAFFTGSGLLLVTTVFVISAIAIPLILDKDADFITAIQTSYRAVMRNKAAMAIWASFIVALTFIGIATAFAGLVVLFPILGYATWHSYRALVR